MKCSEQWLREWVNPHLTREILCNTLVMAGLEVEEVKPVAGTFSGVVIGEIKHVTAHTDKSSLHICEVDIGTENLLSIVCGAPNTHPGMKVPVALAGAELPNGQVLKSAVIHGATSNGMLCSAKELGLTEEEGSIGLLELDQKAPVGADLRAYLFLDDYTLDLSITPNRGDCLSVRGLAREIAALTNTPIKSLPRLTIPAIIQDQLPVKVHEEKACPVYIGRVIRRLRLNSTTPVWLKERLSRSGTRSIHPVVDIVNYVMLELGQPMHAFDLDTLDQSIHIRYAKKNEKVLLLDQKEYELSPETLIIADQTQPLAIAGVMGGLDSSVTSSTENIFLESAYFLSEEVAKARQYYHLNSDSAYRFERGIDPTIQREAIERASQLILEVLGGEAGPIIEKNTFLNTSKKITINQKKIENVLGFVISIEEIEKIFLSLQFIFEYQEKDHTWIVDVPSYRNDLTLPEDLIEEIARLYGYDRIPVSFLQTKLQLHSASANELMNQVDQLKLAFMQQGFHEIISYSFVDKEWQVLLDPTHSPKVLLNPITADMSVMRTNLWPGLIQSMVYNQSRQQNRICLFEVGTCFIERDQELRQETKLAGLLTGLSSPLQWGKPNKEVDFYDLKGKIEDILINFKFNKTLVFKLEQHAALHPGQTAGIYLDEQRCGIIGALHPEVIKNLDISDKTGKIFLFELNLPLPKAGKFDYHEISRFPEIRRDLAIIVNAAIPVKDIQDTIKKEVGSWLREVFVFDVYQGKGISPGLKSVALALILQHPTRTLVDGEVADLMERTIIALQDQLGAALRS